MSDNMDKCNNDYWYVVGCSGKASLFSDKPEKHAGVWLALGISPEPVYLPNNPLGRSFYDDPVRVSVNFNILDCE